MPLRNTGKINEILRMIKTEVRSSLKDMSICKFFTSRQTDC